MINTARLLCEPWGELPGGHTVHRFTLRNEQGMKVAISDLGATLVSWHAPDRTGRFGDILLGHDTPADYFAANVYMGAIIGRWANRIAHARFALDGVEYTLAPNEGTNLLHGGASGFHRARWHAATDNNALVLALESPESDAGFPGNVSVRVRYTLDDDGTLSIDYEALADTPTPLNLTNHAYFNLTGEAGSDIRGHMMGIDADAFFEVDASRIPTRRADVTGHPFDFRQSALIGARLDQPHAQLVQAGGFDHCYVLNASAQDSALPERPIRQAACAYDPASGRQLTVFTDQRGVQFYTGNYLQGVTGRNGVRYQRHAGMCLEAGAFPNEVNMEDSEHVIVRPGTRYRQVTRYRVDVKSEG